MFLLFLITTPDPVLPTPPDRKQSLLWLVYFHEAISSNVVVQCDDHYLLREDQYTVQLPFSAPIICGSFSEDIISMLGLLESNDLYRWGYRRRNTVLYDMEMLWQGQIFVICSDKRRKEDPQKKEMSFCVLPPTLPLSLSFSVWVFFSSILRNTTRNFLLSCLLASHHFLRTLCLLLTREQHDQSSKTPCTQARTHWMHTDPHPHAKTQANNASLHTADCCDVSTRSKTTWCRSLRATC